jgi:hypothetical protein
MAADWIVLGEKEKEIRNAGNKLGSRIVGAVKFK